METFLPGLELARSFYMEAVRPILREHFPRFTYAAALVGSGSEVLGFDSARSADHHWGPRVMLFAETPDVRTYAAHVREQLATRLPASFRGISTNFGEPDAQGVRLLESADGPPIAHRVDVIDVAQYFQDQLGFDPRAEITSRDWLFTPSQRLLELTSGDVFDDQEGLLNTARASLTWYPADVWRFLIARQWLRISQEEAFVGRCAEAGDELGSRIAAARIVRDLMRLCFLVERAYAPYGKWLGTAFQRLQCADELAPLLEAVVAPGDYRAREAALAGVYEAVATLHNALAITPPLDVRVRAYYRRPYLVLRADRFAAATFETLQPSFAAAHAHLPGSIDQIIDNVDALQQPEQWRRVASAYA